MSNAKLVQVGKPRPTGAIFQAVSGTALPADESTALVAAYEERGYASSEGLSRAITRAFAEIKEWGGKTVLRPQTESGVSFDFTLIENSGAVAKAVYGEAAVTITPATPTEGTKVDVAFNGDELPTGVWNFDMVNPGTKGLRRIVAANAQVTTEDFTQTYSGESEIQYPVNLTCFPDDDGFYFYEYSDDGLVTAV